MDIVPNLPKDLSKLVSEYAYGYQTCKKCKKIKKWHHYYSRGQNRVTCWRCRNKRKSLRKMWRNSLHYTPLCHLHVKYNWSSLFPIGYAHLYNLHFMRFVWRVGIPLGEEYTILLETDGIITERTLWTARDTELALKISIVKYNL